MTQHPIAPQPVQPISPKPPPVQSPVLAATKAAPPHAAKDLILPAVSQVAHSEKSRTPDSGKPAPQLKPNYSVIPQSVVPLQYLPMPSYQFPQAPTPPLYQSQFSFAAVHPDPDAYGASYKISKPRKHHNQYIDVNKLKPSAARDAVERPYRCQHAGCEWAFARQSDLRRHAKSHAEPLFHCPYWKNDPTCHKNRGAFNRLDVLKRHLKLVHYIQDKQNVLKSSKEDSGWCRSCQKMFANSKSFVAHCIDCAAAAPPSKWLTHTANPQESPERPSILLTENTSNLLTLSSVVDEFENSEKRMDERKL